MDRECLECQKCGYPTTCVKCNFNITDLNPLAVQLGQKWYPAIPFISNGLLEHEWCKHGTCTNMTMIQYFNVSLNIYDMILDKHLLDKCDYNSDQCYFTLNKDLQII